MRAKFAIYGAAGLTLCIGAIAAALGIINQVAYASATQAHPNAILDLRAPDDSYQRVGIGLLLIATQLVVIVYARKLNGQKQSGQ